MTGSLLVAGTTSDAGKSIVTTALCRALARTGRHVAPFKAQNMSNNSMVTADGMEIGRAQWVQALAARATPEAAMNPVLLKPGTDTRSHVVVMGSPLGSLEATDFAGGRATLRDAAYAAYDDLRSRFDVVVCEGAGSPTEINLRAWDYVNMGLARHGQIPTVVVGDIDRGGVFAAIYGTLALLDAADQALIAGFVVNKFRGEHSLLAPALEAMPQLTGRPVLGVLPWQPELWLDSEDALDLSAFPASTGDATAQLRVAVVRLPRISNFTDVDALAAEPGVDVTFVHGPRGLDDVDVVTLPGTRATMADLAWLHDQGLVEPIQRHAERGGVVLGICGGFQMLGHSLEDPGGVEGPPGARMPGLGLLGVRTTFTADKVLALPQGRGLGVAASGYAIHHGRVDVEGTDEPFLGGARRGGVFGTLWHGSLEGDEFRRTWLRLVADLSGRDGFSPDPGLVFQDLREARIDALADLVEKHLDMDKVADLIDTGAPRGLPFVPPGAPAGMGGRRGG